MRKRRKVESTSIPSISTRYLFIGLLGSIVSSILIAPRRSKLRVLRLKSCIARSLERVTLLATWYASASRTVSVVERPKVRISYWFRKFKHEVSSGFPLPISHLIYLRASRYTAIYAGLLRVGAKLTKILNLRHIPPYFK